MICDCGGEIVGSGGIQDYGGTHHGYVWGGNCVKCGRGYGENEDEPPVASSSARLPAAGDRPTGMRTWQGEGAVVALVLSATVLASGGASREWLGALAVQLTFHHAAIADRLAEREAARVRPDVECYRWSARLFVGKELLWLVYFASSHTWSALAGVALFLAYPLWRRWWRQSHPLAAVAPPAAQPTPEDRT